MSAARRLLVFVLTSFACIHSHGLEIEVKRNSITVSGPIVEGDFERFRRAVDRFGPLRVELSGPGGLVLEAMRIGRLVRAKGIETTVLGYQDCSSACVLIYAGGLVRTAESTSRFGLHMSSGAFSDEMITAMAEIIDELGPESVPLIVSQFESGAGQSTLAQANYFLKMGVSLKVLELASAVNHLDIEYLSYHDAKNLNLVNSN